MSGMAEEPVRCTFKAPPQYKTDRLINTVLQPSMPKLPLNLMTEGQVRCSAARQRAVRLEWCALPHTVSHTNTPHFHTSYTLPHCAHPHLTPSSVPPPLLSLSLLPYIPPALLLPPTSAVPLSFLPVSKTLPFFPTLSYPPVFLSPTLPQKTVVFLPPPLRNGRTTVVPRTLRYSKALKSLHIA